MSVQDVAVRTLDEQLEASAATPAFKRAVQALAEGKDDSAIAFNPESPPVKVLRFISKLLEEFPELAFESIRVQAESGCSEFTGTAEALPGPLRIVFEWNCLWRAEERGWKDAFGDPDQIRAAQEFGYQCFRRFERA